jgi:hypothetical protein
MSWAEAWQPIFLGDRFKLQSLRAMAFWRWLEPDWLSAGPGRYPTPAVLDGLTHDDEPESTHDI